MNRAHKLYRHILGTDPKNDELIYREKDKASYLFITKTRSKKYLILRSWDMVTSEVRYLDADNPTGHFKTIHPRQPKMLYYVAHHGDAFYIRTNDNAPNFKVMKVAIKNPSKKYWKEVIPHRDSVKVVSIKVFRDHIHLMKISKQKIILIC